MKEKLTINGIDFELDSYNVNELLHTVSGSTSIYPERDEVKQLARGWFFDRTKLNVLVHGKSLIGMVTQIKESVGELIEFDLTVDLEWESAESVLNFKMMKAQGDKIELETNEKEPVKGSIGVSDIVEILEKHGKHFFPNGYSGGFYIERDKFVDVAKEIVDKINNQ